MFPSLFNTPPVCAELVWSIPSQCLYLLLILPEEGLCSEQHELSSRLSPSPRHVVTTLSVWFEFLGRLYSFRIVVVPSGCSDPPSVHQTHIPSTKEFLSSPPTNILNLWCHHLEATQFHWSLCCSLLVFHNKFFWL